MPLPSHPSSFDPSFRESDRNYVERMSAENCTPKLTIASVKAQLKAVGVRFKRLPDTGEFVVGSDGKPGSGYYTDSLRDALATGLHMAQLASVPPSAIFGKLA